MAMMKSGSSKADDAQEEADEKPFEKTLTPLGKRTLAGYCTRFGEEEGETKFQAALKNGTIDPAKMVKSSSAASKS